MPRIFSAEKRVGVPSVITGQIVMIARIEGEKNMVAIEKIGESLYAICSLKKDLKVKEIRTMSKMSKDANHAARTRTNQEKMQIDGEEWWRGLSTHEYNTEINGEINLQFLVEEPAITEFPLILTLLTPDVRLTTVSVPKYLLMKHFRAMIQNRQEIQDTSQAPSHLLNDSNLSLIIQFDRNMLKPYM